MRASFITLAALAAFSISASTACPETGCRTATSSGGGISPNIYGGYRDTVPDDSVRRNDDTEIITPGRLTDVKVPDAVIPLRDNHSEVVSETPEAVTVKTGTVAVEDDEVGPPTTNDNDGATPSEKIIKPVKADEDDSSDESPEEDEDDGDFSPESDGDDGGFGAVTG